MKSLGAEDVSIWISAEKSVTNNLSTMIKMYKKLKELEFCWSSSLWKIVVVCEKYNIVVGKNTFVDRKYKEKENIWRSTFLKN